MPDFVRKIPTDDNRDRLVCRDCGYVAYENPKIVVGSVVVLAGQVLLCRRAIAPREGFWTLPAGYMELGETVEEGALREAAEEACAAIRIDGLLAVFTISRLSQVQIFFRARFADLAAPSLFAVGAESLEVGLFAWADIPWSEIAFPSVHWALAAWQSVGDGPLGAPAGNPVEDARGTGGLSSLGLSA